MDLQAIIHVENLSKQYKNSDFLAVDNLSLDIQKGEIFGLLGPNGAGKTTLISMLCGLIKPTSGHFSIDQKTYKENGLAIRESIGVVPQEYALYPTLTAHENLSYFGAMHGLEGKRLKELVNVSLEKMGLMRFANKQVGTFSGGMKRRVNLLAGVLHRPKVLFLDEPTVGVDVQSKNSIIDFLKALNGQGTTIVYTSHHLIEAQELCDRIAIIEGGKIIAQGTPAALIKSVVDARNLEDVFIAMTGRGLRDGI
ncbi:ABC transporter ATP-binding protein [Sphingobacterium pedocola]|uniref:ABC transporter ATP-binding protein n=1 Tax=Sphingobacterium pedocola TaxID=2082722 RepID=A0ABR9T8W5_9SPHI|nr:ABC transporter ATP-binding protein [Sphingobacterium pedocola]MBE8721735.1 ABC transporter ATP-binding protein [Sphingobacterium pedocola]